MSGPLRIQRKRTKGWRMPANTVYVGRSRGEWSHHAPFANPFRVGGYFKIGNGGAGFAWLEVDVDYADSSFTKIESAAEAIAMFEEYRRRYPYTAAEIAGTRGKNLACWCKLCARHDALGGKPLNETCADCAPCHVDPLGRIANDFACDAPASPTPQPQIITNDASPATQAGIVQ